MIRAVVFDLWNTLVVNPGGSPFQQIAALLTPEQQQHFADLQRDGMTRSYLGAGAFLGAWRDRLGLSVDQMEAMISVFHSAEREAQLFPDAVDAVTRTGALARVALLSNTQSFNMGLLDALGLANQFRVMGISSELGFLKPDPSAFEAIRIQLALFPGELALVGDSWRDDVEGALNAGWTAIWLNCKAKPRPPHDPDAELVEIPDLSFVPAVIERLQAGARCSTCLG